MPFVSAPGQTTAKPQKGVSGKKVPLSLLESQSLLVYRRKKTKTFKTTNPVYLNPVLQHPLKNFKAGSRSTTKEERKGTSTRRIAQQRHRAQRERAQCHCGYMPGRLAGREPQPIPRTPRGGLQLRGKQLTGRSMGTRWSSRGTP